jgi:hypothetical protein
MNPDQSDELQFMQDTSDKFENGHVTFKINPPAYIYILGRTMFGKSSLIHLLLTEGCFTPLPDLIILQLGESDDETLAAKFDEFGQALKSMRKYAGMKNFSGDNVVAVTSLSEGKEAISQYKMHVGLHSKPSIMWVLDDSNASVVSDELNGIITNKIHHWNLYLIHVTQMTYPKGGKQSRDNVTHMIIMPGYTTDAITRLLSQNLTKEAKAYVLEIYGNEESKDENMSSDDLNIKLKIPVIIEKTPDNPTVVKVYNGIWDPQPVTFALNKTASSSTSLNSRIRSILDNVGGGDE